MKTYILLIIFLLVSCDTQSENGNETPTEPEKKEIKLLKPLNDIVIPFGKSFDETFILTEYYSFDGEDQLSFELENNSNTALIDVDISGTTLHVKSKPDVTGCSDIQIKVKTASLTLLVTVKITITESIVLTHPLNDISLTYGQPLDSTFTLTNHFEYYGEQQLTFSIEQNSNPSLITTTLSNNGLNLKLNDGVSGKSEIIVKATAGILTVSDTLLVEVKESFKQEKKLEDINLNYGEQLDTIINLTDFFKYQGAGELSFSIEGNSNASLIESSISGSELNVKHTSDTTGIADIIIKAFTPTESLTDTFRVSVNESQGLKSYKNGETEYKSRNYTQAETAFKVAINDPYTKLKAKGYVGLGFTQILLKKYDEALTSFNKGLELNTEHFSSDLNAGLAFLNYSYSNDYTKAIAYAKEVISSDANFKMILDEKINIKDIHLTLALSYYETQEFQKCLDTLKEIYGDTLPEIGSTNFHFKLLEILNQLSKNLRNS